MKNPGKNHNKRFPGVFGAVKNKQLFEKLYPVAVNMRRKPTGLEQILWKELRGKKLGVKFRRQHLIDQFIVDFYCVELGLVIELDGSVHRKQRSADLEREQVLKALGCLIVRFDNQTVEKELPEVIGQIKEAIRNLSE